MQKLIAYGVIALACVSVSVTRVKSDVVQISPQIPHYVPYETSPHNAIIHSGQQYERRPTRCLNVSPRLREVSEVVYRAEELYTSGLHCIPAQCAESENFRRFATRNGAYEDINIVRGTPLPRELLTIVGNTSGSADTRGSNPIISNNSPVSNYHIRGLIGNTQSLCPAQNADTGADQVRDTCDRFSGKVPEHTFARSLLMTPIEAASYDLQGHNGPLIFRIQHQRDGPGSTLIDLSCSAANKYDCGCVPSILENSVAAIAARYGGDSRSADTEVLSSKKRKVEVFGPILIPNKIAKAHGRLEDVSGRVAFNLRYIIAAEGTTERSVVESISRLYESTRKGDELSPQASLTEELLERVADIPTNYVDIASNGVGPELLTVGSYAATCKSDKDYCMVLYNVLSRIISETTHIDRASGGFNRALLLSTDVGSSDGTYVSNSPFAAGGDYIFNFTDNPFYDGLCEHSDTHCIRHLGVGGVNTIPGTGVNVDTFPSGGEEAGSTGSSNRGIGGINSGNAGGLGTAQDNKGGRGTNSDSEEGVNATILVDGADTKVTDGVAGSTRINASARVHVKLHNVGQLDSVIVNNEEHFKSHHNTNVKVNDNESSTLGTHVGGYTSTYTTGSDASGSDHTRGSEVIGGIGEGGSALQGNRDDATYGSTNAGGIPIRTIIVTVAATASTAVGAGLAIAFINHKKNKLRAPSNIRVVSA